MKAARRIRIIFSDPDATDSDSGDDATSGARRRTEIVILHGNSCGTTKNDPSGFDSQAQAIGSSSMSAAAASSGPVPNRRHRGVYERQPGRWAAEFRSHRLKVRHWVGTFPTEEEARAAYDAFEKHFLSSPSRRLGVPAPSERGGNGGGVRRASSRPPPDEKRQIVLALATARMPPPASIVVPSAPCASSSTSASPPPPPPFWNARRHDADAPPSLHSIWADEPADEFLLGLSDLAHLPLPFTGASMDFDPADLSLFDNGFL